MMESLGQLLQQARQARGISLEQAAQATHIRLHYLQALEADDQTALPSPVHARGFIRLYAGYLGLNPDGLSPSSPGQPRQEQPAPAASPAESIKAPAKIPLWKRLIPERNARAAAASAAPAVDSGDDETAEGSLPAGEAGFTQAVAPGPAAAAPDQQAPTDPQPVSPAPAPRVSTPLGPALTGWKTAAEPHGKVVSTESHAILREIGRTLAQRREVLGLAVADIEHYTHVRGHYIQALEEGRIEEFLSPVQARGMLSNYARFMNLDVDTLLLRFADALQTRRVENLSPQKTPRPAAQVVPRFSLRRFFTVDLVAGSLLIIAMVAFLFWGVTQVLDYRSSLDATPSLPAVVDVLSPSETATPAQTAVASDATQAALTTTPGQDAASPTPPAQATVLVTVPPGAASSSLQLYVIAKEQVWLRVVVDGGTAFQGRTAPGAAYNFAGSQNIVLTTGNAAGLLVLFNQTDLGVLGGYAQVVNLVFDANGVQTPTPLATLTRTATPLVSPTLGSLTKTPGGTPTGATPTAALTSTPTPRPTPSRTPTITPTR